MGLGASKVAFQGHLITQDFVKKTFTLLSFYKVRYVLPTLDTT